jgi:hypothetical protein
MEHTHARNICFGVRRANTLIQQAHSRKWGTPGGLPKALPCLPPVRCCPARPDKAPNLQWHTCSPCPCLHTSSWRILPVHSARHNWWHTHTHTVNQEQKHGTSFFITTRHCQATGHLCKAKYVSIMQGWQDIRQHLGMETS